MKTLHLNLIKVWFDMINEGYKKEEYRTIKPYFCQKFLLYKGEIKSRAFWEGCFSYSKKGLSSEQIDYLKEMISNGYVSFQDFDTITFSNGMTPPVPRYTKEFLGIEIREGKPEWGAVTGTKYFVLKLGKIITK